MRATLLTFVRLVSLLEEALPRYSQQLLTAIPKSMKCTIHPVSSEDGQLELVRGSSNDDAPANEGPRSKLVTACEVWLPNCSVL